MNAVELGGNTKHDGGPTCVSPPSEILAPGGAANYAAAAIAFSMIDKASSSSASGMTSGGRKRNTLP